MAVTAASTHVPARESADSLAADELIRETRERLDKERRDRRVAFATAAGAAAFVVAATSCVALIGAGPSLAPLTVALFVAVYAAASRVKFEIGTGSAVPTQLVLVPLLFAVPTGAVPLVVAAGLVVHAAAGSRRLPSPQRALPLLASSLHAVGPTVVVAAAGGLPLRMSAWPVYLAALAAQFGCDFAGATITGRLGHGVPLRTLARFMSWIWLVDAALAPIGLAIAVATRRHTWLVVLVLPLVALLQHFARERQRRIDHALELSDAYRGTAFLLGDVVEADDAYTGSHSRHVVDLVLAVCDELRLDSAERRNAEFVALLHDVGKIRIPAEIINKPGALTPEERAVIETHTVEGQRMLEQVGGLLGEVGRLVRSCHERWDGGGYPDGLVGEETPLVARIVCACDAFSAMTTDRPYRRARSTAEALAELERCAATQFDPQVVEALVRVSR